MAARKKQGLEFFRLDTELTDRERYLIPTGGPELFASWVALRMELFKCGCCLAFGAVERASFCFSYGYDEKKLSGILQELFKAKLFHEDTYKTTSFLTSKDIQRQYVTACMAAKRKEIKLPRQVLLLPEGEYEGEDTISLYDLRVEESRVEEYANVSGVTLQDSGNIPEESAASPPSKKQSSKGKTICKPDSVSKDYLESLVINPRYGNGDANLVLECFEEMYNWSTGKGEKRLDWPACLRNWILKERKRGRASRAKTFTEIENDNFNNALDNFFNED